MKVLGVILAVETQVKIMIVSHSDLESTKIML